MCKVQDVPTIVITLTEEFFGEIQVFELLIVLVLRKLSLKVYVPILKMLPFLVKNFEVVFTEFL